MWLKYLVLIYFLINNVGCLKYLLKNNLFYEINNEMMLDSCDNCTIIDVKIYERWIEQKVDHFNSDDQRKWKMRYFERLDFWKPGGPIYLFIGGESTVSPKWASAGLTYDLANETNGALYVSEHRYYGKSKPFNETNVENFKFLSARQALADLEKLLKYIKKRLLFKYSKIVVVGGSYSGNLAAWMKLLYPNLVNAAISSSAPVLAKKDFYEYLEKVGEAYEHFGTRDCLDNIKQIFKRYDKLLKSPEGIEQLKKEKNICEHCDLSISENRQSFFSNQLDEFMSNAQYGKEDNIKQHCQRLNESIWLEPNENNQSEPCHDYDFHQLVNDEDLHSVENDWVLTWYYQICTEFGYFTTTNSTKQPFTDNIPVSFFVKICMGLLGPEFNETRIDEGIKKTNDFFGGLQPNVSEVVFSNGDLDPWSRLSILEDLSYKAPAVVIPFGSHSRDIGRERDTDSEELKEARKYIKYLVKKWIGVKDYIHAN